MKFISLFIHQIKCKMSSIHHFPKFKIKIQQDEKGNNINLNLPLTKYIKRTHNAHVFNMSFENNRPESLDQGINQHGISVHMLYHYGTIFHKISNSQVLQFQVLRSSKSLIILCIKHNSVVILENLQGPNNGVDNAKSCHKIPQPNIMSSGSKIINELCLHSRRSNKSLLFQDITPLAIIKMYPEVDFLSYSFGNIGSDPSILDKRCLYHRGTHQDLNLCTPRPPSCQLFYTQVYNP